VSEILMDMLLITVGTIGMTALIEGIITLIKKNKGENK
jgi:hypothetical protein